MSESAVSAKRGWVSFGAKPAQSETPVRAAAKRRPRGRGRSGEKDGVAFRLRMTDGCLGMGSQHTAGTHEN